jgi:hypothetical protein
MEILLPLPEEPVPLGDLLPDKLYNAIWTKPIT